jgi:hypothetical protein
VTRATKKAYRWNDDPRVVPFLAVSWGLIMSAVLLLTKPVWKSVETGTFPQGPEVAAYVAGRAQAGNAMVTDFITREPLRYYQDRFGFYETTDTLRRQPLRIWVVLHRDKGLREERVRHRLRLLGAPPLNEDNSVFESGNTAVYLYELYELAPEGGH